MPGNKKEWYTQRDDAGTASGLYRYLSYLLAYCFISNKCIDALAEPFKQYKKQLKIDNDLLDSCDFFMIPVSKPGAYDEEDVEEASTVPPEAITKTSLLHPGNKFQTIYTSTSDEGFMANDAFKREVEPYRVTRHTIKNKMLEFLANEPKWFKLRTLPETEHMLGSDSNWVEQRWSKLESIFLPYLGQQSIVCRAGAPCDVVLRGVARAELKTGWDNGCCHFESTKQARMWPDDGGERQLDMLIQFQWNLDDESKWLEVRVLTHKDFSREDIQGEGHYAYIPAAFFNKKENKKFTLRLPAPDAVDFDAKLKKFGDDLARKVHEACEDSTMLPAPHLHAPNAEMLRDPSYHAAWLNIPRRMLFGGDVPKRLIELIRLIKQREPKRELIPDRWPRGTRWTKRTAAKQWPHQEAGQPHRVCPSCVKRDDGSYRYRTKGFDVECRGWHESGVEGRRCMESTGQTKALTSFENGWKWCNEDGTIHTCKNEGTKTFAWKAKPADASKRKLKPKSKPKPKPKSQQADAAQAQQADPDDDEEMEEDYAQA